jgi:TRAP-type mannitol/chloroaromatic compound transport system substrate-binding protein
MKRREFVKATAVGVAAGTLGGGCSKSESASAPAAHTAPNIRWRLVSSFPRSLETLYGAAEVLARRVEQLTDGRFKIRVFPAGEVVPGLQVLDAVQQNTAEMGHSAGYYYIGKNPALAFDAAVPFGLTARQQLAWLSQGRGKDLMRGVFSDFNIINFPGGNTGVQMGGWFRRRINSIADIKGLKIRIPGLGGEVMNRLGATVQVLAGGDIYAALERGAIDATEWVGPHDDLQLGFHQIAKYYYYPGWWEPGPGLSFYVSKNAWSTLPSAYQAAIESAAAEASGRMMIEYDAKNPPALARLRKEGVELVPFPEDVMSAAHTQAESKIAELVAADSTYRQIFEDWNRFKQESSSWFATAEQAYSNFVYKNL